MPSCHPGCGPAYRYQQFTLAAGLLTAISNYCFAAIPGKMCAFNSNMRQNAYQSTILPFNILRFVAMLLLRNEDQQ